jgi:DNA polymerase-3 subunit alpha
MSKFFHTHVHSEFSCLDGMADIATMAEKAKGMGQPALSLTDHGNMSGAFQLYKACKKSGILPFVGLEAYIVEDLSDKKARRNHLSLLAYTTEGYKNLVKLSTRSNQRTNYYYKPRVDLSDLAELSAAGGLRGIVALTGCYFGMVTQNLVHGYPERAERLTKMLAKWFDAAFVELQHHNTDHSDGWSDQLVVDELRAIASSVGVPTIISQDSHYCDKADKSLHNMMRMIAYSADENDLSYPGDSYHLATTDWVRGHYNHETWEACEESYGWLLDNHSLSIPPLDTYKYFVPSIVKKPMAELSLTCSSLLKQSGKDSPEYQARLAEELGVIEKTGMADYFILVHDYVKWCAENEILVMARGSAASSLVCYLLGITQVDPIEWGLLFERFLSVERTRPPDIDLDIEDVRRDDVVEYLKGKYDITQIGTYSRLSYDEETGRGGLFVQYMSAKRKILGDQFARKLGRVKDLHDLDAVNPSDAQRLRELGEMPLRRSPGAHAAGFVVSAPPLHKTEDWIPEMLIPSSDTMVTQMMMDDVEDAGFIKIDLLGLRSLTTLRRCLELVGRTGTGWIPLDDHRTLQFLRIGRTETGIFQMEGWSAARGCKEVQVKSVRDLILVNALYRPATIDSGYVKKFLHNRKNPSEVKYPSDIFRRHLEETFGVPCFQEQVLSILKDLGMPVHELNAFLKAVKGKHAVAGVSAESVAIFDKNKERFARLCADNGMGKRETTAGWKLVEGFAAYGFNRAHATAYSLLGYQLAYLKTHHPLEFHAALLETTVGTDKEKQYLKETKRVGVKVLPPDVNYSGPSWAIDSKAGAIRCGLASIKGIGFAAAEAIVQSAPYSSVDDMLAKCPPRAVTGGKNWKKDGTLSGVMEKLRDAGALSSLGIRR